MAAQLRQNGSVALLSGATSTGSGEAHNPWGPKLSAQAVGRTTSGAGSATVAIQVSDVPVPTEDGHWLTAFEIAISMTDETADYSDGQQMDACWRHVRANVTAISGTGAEVDVYLGG